MTTTSPQQHDVLIDTDIGSDLDDALALAYLLANDACNIVGITTTTGQPDLRAKLASVLCVHAGRNVRIHAGESVPLNGGPQGQPDVPQAIALDRWPSTDPHGSDGAQFLVDTITAAPGRIALLCLAPLTTVARAMQLDPELTTKLAGLVIMGGNFSNRPGRPRIEWNFAVDPDAAAHVYATARCPIRTISLDVTHDVALNKNELQQLATCAELLRPALDMGQAHFDRYPEVFLHDPLAAATIFHPDMCTYDTGTVTITRNGDEAGRSEIAPNRAGKHAVSRTVHASRFLDYYATTLADTAPRSQP
jgi:purine nucleosidase